MFRIVIYILILFATIYSCPEGYVDSANTSQEDCIPELFYHNSSTQQAAYFFNEVYFDGVLLESDDWVGAFNGDVCVGSRKWDGNYLKGTLLVWGEQGIGDHIIFSSMLFDLKNYAKNILLQIDKRLENLLERYFKKINFLNIKIISAEKKFTGNFDKHIAIGSLGQYLRKSRASFKTTPKKYLISSAIKENEYKKKFLNNNKFKIGISWKTLNKMQQYRNIDLKKMLPILSNPNCDFVSLQFGKFDDELKYIKSKFGINIKSIDKINNYHDIDELAALINCLDLVITIQNSTAHLAGALGKNTWLMLVNNARWHWLKNETKSIWYPSIKIYRQEKNSNWNSVINNIFNDLKSFINQNKK